jgi:hypothetical protein
MPITPEQFKAAWLAVSEKHRLSKTVVANFAFNVNGGRRNEGRLPRRGHVTNGDITRIAERVLFDVAEGLKLGTTWEWPPIKGNRRALDAVLFAESKDGTRTPEVAWEHENNVGKCEEEIARFITYRAPLSVLVTYLWVKETPNLAKKWLPDYQKWFERRPVEGREFLVIFATVKGEWEFYRYHQPTGFKEMH